MNKVWIKINNLNTKKEYVFVDEHSADDLIFSHQADYVNKEEIQKRIDELQFIYNEAFNQQQVNNEIVNPEYDATFRQTKWNDMSSEEKRKLEKELHYQAYIKVRDENIKRVFSMTDNEMKTLQDIYYKDLLKVYREDTELKQEILPTTDTDDTDFSKEVPSFSEIIDDAIFAENLPNKMLKTDKIKKKAGRKPRPKPCEIDNGVNDVIQ
jgi:hypothetical protein